MNKRMIIDVDHAHQHYCDTVEEILKTDFLKLIGMSWQTYHNLQNSKGKQRTLQYAEKIKEVTGLSLDQIIKQN